MSVAESVTSGLPEEEVEVKFHTPPNPVVEWFGHPVGANTEESKRDTEKERCPFNGGPCEKCGQYEGMAYCSISAPTGTLGEKRVYMVCDHRLDGYPLALPIEDYFGEDARKVILTDEVVVGDNRDISNDFVAFTEDMERFIAIETQSNRLRGTVKSAWKALEKGTLYIPNGDEHHSIDHSNTYKSLAIQVGTKARYLKRIGSCLYVLLQQPAFDYLHERVRFEHVSEGWDITFMTFDFTGKTLPNGRFDLAHMSTYRTTLESYLSSLCNCVDPVRYNRAYFKSQLMLARQRKEVPYTSLLT